MDYEVLLVARVLEARRSGFSEIDAIVEGVAKTGGLITSAAAIMVVVRVCGAWNWWLWGLARL
jgi:RND superfamily putative drug exporter